MSKLFTTVYAFEINDSLTCDLQCAGLKNVRVINKGLSSKAGQATLYIPVLNGLPLVGWASLAPNSCPETDQHVQKQVETCTLDSFALSEVSFIKIDVEGHELEVLRGPRHDCEGPSGHSCGGGREKF